MRDRRENWSFGFVLLAACALLAVFAVGACRPCEGAEPPKVDAMFGEDGQRFTVEGLDAEAVAVAHKARQERSADGYLYELRADGWWHKVEGAPREVPATFAPAVGGCYNGRCAPAAPTYYGGYYCPPCQNGRCGPGGCPSPSPFGVPAIPFK